MLSDEEFDIIARKYFAKIRSIGYDMMDVKDVDIPSKVEEMNEILGRIKEIRAIQRKQRGEQE